MTDFRSKLSSYKLLLFLWFAAGVTHLGACPWITELAKEEVSFFFGIHIQACMSDVN